MNKDKDGENNDQSKPAVVSADPEGRDQRKYAACDKDRGGLHMHAWQRRSRQSDSTASCMTVTLLARNLIGCLFL